MVEPSSDRRAVFRGVVSLALHDGNLSFGEKRLITKLAMALRLDDDEPKMIYDAILEEEKLEDGHPLTISEKFTAYEQVLETFLINTNKTDDELRMIAYLRRVFEISDSEHRAILSSLDRQLEDIVHRNVKQSIRFELKEINKRLSEILESVRIQR
ncbi:TPA: hypothetical protein HA324_04025 [Candidatus Thalassarchaeaceae archaeon]|jgi:hypothetical protein|nr:hypothetical protein [Euryarchaeota archaeon]MDG1547668.1 hypothetical protein [Candidatus Thalassarchaeaceae archaeon]DAC63010.1 MAG TPA: hypothetical protein D7I02_02900 [Candidatus Poseidoniales archaeon]MBT4180329.1 hypothetical protein [Euryarchaeota archaeon]MBT4474774.1 hypothetical protein [Euryarchaeota archaeon]|tara:strand:- start:437 stop:904 length:468 start_codon:yes stop_codon:yes gene_type:complete